MKKFEKRNDTVIKDNQNTLNRLHVVIDALLVIAAFYLAYPLRFNVLTEFKWFALEEGEAFLSFQKYSENMIFLVPGYLVIYYICGLYRPKRGRRSLRIVGNLLEANLIGIFYFAFLLYIGKAMDISRWFYILFGTLNFTFGAIFRLGLIKLLKLMRKKGRNLKHVLMIGYSRTAEGYIDRLNNNSDWGYSICGILDDTMVAGTRYHGVSVIGTIAELEQNIADNDYDEIVISLCIDEYEKLEQIVNICEKSGLHTKFVPDYGTMISTVPYIEDLYGLPVINIRNVPLSNTMNLFIKRLMDIVGSLAALVVFAIPMLITAVIIKCTSKGPVIYSQIRVGKHGKEFKMYKFRSMYVETPKEEKSHWTVRGDSRVTPFGKVIRRTSIDELPQLINVLFGTMSLVGPRPERPQFVEKFKEAIPRYMVKHQVRPGMTGWAQINGYRGDTSIKKRIDHDLYYIENWTLWLDIRILFLTIFKGFINKNAY